MKQRILIFIFVCLLTLSLYGAGISAYADASMGYEYLYEKGSEKAPGYWYHSTDIAGYTFNVSFEANNYFNGIYGYYYAPKFNIPVLITVYNEKGNEVWSGTTEFYSDNEKIIEFDKVLKPGFYEVIYEIQEIDLDAFYEANTGDDSPYWVVGSAHADEDRTDVFFEGGLTNEATLETPMLALLICEPDPNATEEPTEEPTQTPTVEPTAESTNTPTNAPSVTNALPSGTPQAVKTPDASQSKADNDNNNTELILCIVICVVVVIASAAIIIILVRKKKKK